MKKLILIFLLLINTVSAHKIGVSPSELKMETSSEFYVLNSNDFETKFRLISETVGFNEDSFTLKPGEKRKITTYRKSKKDGFIEILSGNNLVSSLKIPVEFKNKVLENRTPNKIETSHSLDGIMPVIIFNIFGVFIGVLIWKKKIFWPSQ